MFVPDISSYELPRVPSPEELGWVVRDGKLVRYTGNGSDTEGDPLAAVQVETQIRGGERKEPEKRNLLPQT